MITFSLPALLGVLFDATMNIKEQVSQITHSCYAQLRIISQIRRYITPEATKRLVHAFITSRLDNHNSMIFGVPDYLVDKLQLIQNHAAQVITQQRRSDHIIETLIRALFGYDMVANAPPPKK